MDQLLYSQQQRDLYLPIHIIDRGTIKGLRGASAGSRLPGRVFTVYLRYVIVFPHVNDVDPAVGRPQTLIRGSWTIGGAIARRPFWRGLIIFVIGSNRQIYFLSEALSFLMQPGQEILQILHNWHTPDATDYVFYLDNQSKSLFHIWKRISIKLLFQQVFCTKSVAGNWIDMGKFI